MPAARPPLAFVGAGAAVHALLPALRDAGWPIAGVVSRMGGPAIGGAALLGSPTAPDPSLADVPLVVLAVRDSAIAAVSRELAAAAGPWTGRLVLHLSGALASDEASALRDAGAAVASWHPLTTLSRIGGIPPGVPFFAEGDEPAMVIAAELSAAIGGRLHRLSPGAKPAYHAAATLAGNLVAVLIASAADVLRGAGVAEPEAALALLARSSVDAAVARPGLSSLTGPVARADAGTLAVNIAALAGAPASVRAAHAALSMAANAVLRERAECTNSALRDDVDEVLRAELAEAVAGLLGDPGTESDFG